MHTLKELTLIVLVCTYSSVAYAADGNIKGVGPFQFGMSRDDVARVLKDHGGSLTETDEANVATNRFLIGTFSFSPVKFLFSSDKRLAVVTLHSSANYSSETEPVRLRESGLWAGRCLAVYGSLLAQVKEKYGTPDVALPPVVGAFGPLGGSQGSVIYRFKDGSQLRVLMVATPGGGGSLGPKEWVSCDLDLTYSGPPARRGFDF